VRAALAHRHGLDAVLEEEVLHYLMDFQVGRNVRGHPPFDNRFITPAAILVVVLSSGPYKATVPMGYSGG
jgi:hypothetical protein